MTMDNDKNLTPLTDEDLIHVAGGTGTGVFDLDSDYCDACTGGPKSITMDGNQRQLTCTNCGKIYKKCPKCVNALFNLTMPPNVIFICHNNRHAFVAYN